MVKWLGWLTFCGKKDVVWSSKQGFRRFPSSAFKKPVRCSCWSRYMGRCGRFQEYEFLSWKLPKWSFLQKTSYPPKELLLLFFFSKWTVARNFFILIFGGFDSIILFTYKHDTPLMEPEILPSGKRDPFVETSIFRFYVKRWGCTNLFEQWKNPGCLAFLGEYTTQLCVDYNLTIIRITTKQPGFNGK